MKDEIHVEGITINEGNYAKMEPAAPAHEWAFTKGTKYGNAHPWRGVDLKDKTTYKRNTKVPERWDRKVRKKTLADEYQVENLMDSETFIVAGERRESKDHQV